jgi:hypothetical protein
MHTGEDVHSLNRRECDRRRRRRTFVWHEQRTGFDRRCPQRSGAAAVLEQTLVGLRDKPAMLRALLVTVNVLNVADFGLTLNVLGDGGGEANPIMRSLFNVGPLWAGLFKIVAVLLTTWLVWRCRSYRLALAAALVMVAVFAAVALYHLFGLAALG